LLPLGPENDGVDYGRDRIGLLTEVERNETADTAGVRLNEDNGPPKSDCRVWVAIREFSEVIPKTEEKVD
jgi:hypothetical protein